MLLWHSNNLGIILCHQSALLHCVSLTCWKLLSFLEIIWCFSFSYDFKSIDHLITLVNWNAESREILITFIALMVSPSANWRAWLWQYVKWTQSHLCILLLQSKYKCHQTLLDLLDFLALTSAKKEVSARYLLLFLHISWGHHLGHTTHNFYKIFLNLH